MTEWAALAIAHVRDFAARYGLADLKTLDYRDIDPSEINHAASWQDNVGAPSRLNVAMTLVLLGERLGTTLPERFALRDDIGTRLLSQGYDWVHVPGVSHAPLTPNQVPLTGTVFEFFDAFLDRADGAHAGALRVIFKGRHAGNEEPDFGNGEFRAMLEAAKDTASNRRLNRKEYEQQLDWLLQFWQRMYAGNQHACLFCVDSVAFAEQLERCLAAEFLSEDQSRPEASLLRRHDATQINLPGPAPYDLATSRLYLGRAPQIAELGRRALSAGLSRRLVPVLGDSGTGKSSLLRAGLLNDANSPARRRLGWRTAFLSLAERRLDESPLAFLASALASPLGLPELGSSELLRQRLKEIIPAEASVRLLQTLAALDLSNVPGLGRPKLLLVVDQLELALDGAKLDSPQLAEEWKSFLHTLAALGNGLIDPAIAEILDPHAVQVAEKLSFSVVVGLPTDRYGAFSVLLAPGNFVFHLPRLVDETALREVITGTFDVLGVPIEREAHDALCADAIQLALATQASILPLVAVTLAALHDDWKQRSVPDSTKRDEKAWLEGGKWQYPVADLSSSQSAVGIRLSDVKKHGRLRDAIERMAGIAWEQATLAEPLIKAEIEKLPISGPRIRALTDEMSGCEFALSRLLRRLVAVSADDTVPDRLAGLPDSEVDLVMRPVAVALRNNRLLTCRDDGAWWLVHQTVAESWERASRWRDAEKSMIRTVSTMEADLRRWSEDVAAGEPDADRWLWTRERQVELAIGLMTEHGAEANAELTAFAKRGMHSAIKQENKRSGRILRIATWFDDTEWSAAILEVTGEDRFAAVNELSKDGTASPLSNACYNRNKDIVQLLLRSGADPNLALASGETPLMLTARVGVDELCAILIAAGSKVDAEDRDGSTALRNATAHGHLSVLRRLIEAGADVNFESCDGGSVLIDAARAGYTEVVVYLLRQGAAVEPTSPEAWSALAFAAQNGHSEVVRLLLNAGANPNRSGPNVAKSTPMMCAAASGSSDVVEILVSVGVNVNQTNQIGDSPLIIAAGLGHENVVRCLLKAGADIEFEGPRTRTSLAVAVAAGHETVVAQLLQAGADVSVADEHRNSVLLIGVGHSKEGVVRQLLKAGANVNVTNNAGTTALMEACALKDTDIVKLLLNHGADTAFRDGNDRSALDIAYLQESKPIVDSLQLAGATPLSVENINIVLETPLGINIGLVVNDQRKVCLVHDRKFKSETLWVGYHVDKRQLEVIFDFGKTYPIDWLANDEWHSHLKSINEILMIRMHDATPVDGYATSFLRIENDKIID